MGAHDDTDDGEHAHVHHRDGDALTFAVLTVTSTRTEGDDESGRVARELIEDAGHDVVEYDTIPDDGQRIVERVSDLHTDAVVTTGGTGITPDDVTVDSLRELFTKEIPGFGEYFRRLSHEQVGTPAMLSRATAGVYLGTVVYALPGNPDAVELGVEEAVLPEVEHAVALAGE